VVALPALAAAPAVDGDGVTVNDCIKTLQALKDQGHGRKQVVLTDWNSTSAVDAIQLGEGKKPRVLISFDYGDLNGDD
jgi:hypothetical protein